MNFTLTIHSVFGLILAALLLINNVTAKDEIETKTNLVSKPEKKISTRIHLKNGDRLSGLPEFTNDSEQLLFHSDSLHQTAKFPLSNIISLHIGKQNQNSPLGTTARVDLQPSFRQTQGDTIMGNLHELTLDSIKLKTWYGGIITIKRSMVRALRVTTNAAGNYHGPNNLAEWHLPKGKNSWTFNQGVISSKSSSSIGKDVQLTEKSHISFKCEWEQAMRFKIRAYSNDVESGSSSAYYELNINRSYAYLQTRGKVGEGGAKVFGGARWQQIKVNNDKDEAQFDCYIDRKAGIVNLFINGIQACILQSQSPDPQDLGTGIEFISEQRYPIDISQISVTPWNGTSLPNKESFMIEAPDSKESAKTKQPPHKIVLINGDEIPGTVGKVKDGRITVETEFTPINIPLERINFLNLGDKREEPKKYSQDVRAWLYEGGYITLRLDSFKDGKINGYNQAIGNVSLDFSAFYKIDFQIYDEEANKIRKELD